MLHAEFRASQLNTDGWLGAYRPGHMVAQPHVGCLMPPLIARGTLVAEFCLERGQALRRPLLQHGALDGWVRHFSLALSPDGQVLLLHQQGKAFSALSLDARLVLDRGGRMRISYQWDAPARSHRLTLEALDYGQIRQANGDNPLPLPGTDAAALLSGHGNATHDEALDWLALSQSITPVGPGACFAPSTPIETPSGPRPAAQLRAGDLVQTANAGAQPVLWSGRVSLPALGALAPIQLSAPYFGRSQDLWLLAHHRVVISGAMVEYLFGADEVLVEARHLVDGITARRQERQRVLSWQGILLDGHHILIADGCRIESLFTGGLAKAPDILATTALASLPQIPLQRRAVIRELCAYEAATLASSRARARAPIAA